MKLTASYPTTHSRYSLFHYSSQYFKNSANLNLAFFKLDDTHTKIGRQQYYLNYLNRSNAI